MKLVLYLMPVFLFLHQEVCGIKDLDDKIIFIWKELTYTEGTNSSDFILGNIIPTAFAYYPPEDKLLIATPRIYKGVPHSLAEIVVRKHQTKKSPSLEPFTGRPTEPIINTYQPIIDDCKNPRLWIIDVGEVEYEGDEAKYKNRSVVSLVAFALTEPDYPEVLRYEIPKYKEPLSFGGFAVDVLNPEDEWCSDTFVYIPNFDEKSLYVFDHKNNDYWTYTHDSFKPDGETILTDPNGSYNQTYEAGLYGIVLGDRDKNLNRPAYYIAGSSTKLWSVNTKILKKRNSFFQAEFIGDRGPNTEAIALAYDPNTQVLFFGESNSRRISCWNTKKAFKNNIDEVYNDKNMILVTDLFIDHNGSLWFMYNGDHLVITDSPKPTLDLPLIRIIKMNPKEAIKGTKCNLTSK